MGDDPAGQHNLLGSQGPLDWMVCVRRREFRLDVLESEGGKKALLVS